ncbi:MAG: DNA polymerase I [Acidobacteriota bacterium]|nr:DNA polymerase I [Acidobacteriota bacterium]
MMGPVLAPRLYLIDSYGFIFRAYHARARMQLPPMRTSTGISTEAVLIFNNMLRKLVKTFEPVHMAAVFESIGPTLREQAFTEYKANRTEMPDDLRVQIPYVRRLLDAMNVPILQFPGFEADDVIGTLSCRAVEAGYEVVIVSSDKDMLQLVNDRVFMLNPAKDDTWYDRAKVKEFMGVEANQVADLLALKGDAIDNIPGAPGIGDKGARELLAQFGSVEAALDRAGEVTKKMSRESLQSNRDRILMSKHLAKIETNVPIEFAFEDLEVRPANAEALKSVYKELEFFSLLKELGPGEDTRERNVAAVDQDWIAAIPAGAPVAVAIVSESGEAQVGLAWKPGEARFGTPESVRALLEDGSRPKIAADVKSVLLLMSRLGIAAIGFEHDVSLYEFLLSADPSASSLDQMVQRRLDLKVDPTPAGQALQLLDLHEMLGNQVGARDLRKVYDEIDLPLAGVLARVEYEGIRVDAEELGRLSGLMETEIARLNREICELADCEFNIGSPQQLGKVLFEKMGLPAPVKYGKGKTISTAADILENLAAEYPIARKVLEYRQLTKLKGTYVDALPALIDRSSGRIHSSFNQSGAATGRLSSSNPNLQNIPIKTELGREIRAAFIPRDGWRLLVADYSQIELRLMAHFSNDPVLVEAFRAGEDIHTRTAAEVMGVPPLMVTREARNNAKAVNFGIVYGISPFGLAAQLGISRKEAETYIFNYFERYAGVRTFIDDTIDKVRKSGVTSTLFGRERPIPDMNSRNPNARGFAERTAVNSPLQGTAADLIKLAMIRIDQRLRGRGTKLLLQVHDELVLESPPEEAEEMAAMVKSEMERVHLLRVPLVADVGIGANWRDAK